MLIHCSHDSPSFCNVVSTAENMSSPVHVPDSPRTWVTLLRAYHCYIPSEQSIALTQTHPWVNPIAKHIFHVSLCHSVGIWYLDPFQWYVGEWYQQTVVFLLFPRLHCLHSNLTDCNYSRFDECFSDGACFFFEGTPYNAFWDFSEIVVLCYGFFSLNNYFSNRRKKGIDLPIFMLNLNYYATQSERSRDPNLGCGPLFADPCPKTP